MQAGIRHRALSLLLPWYVTLLSVPLHRVTQCLPCGCKMMWQMIRLQLMVMPSSESPQGMGPWQPALVPPSWWSTTTELLLSDHMWHRGTPLPREPAPSACALEHQRGATALQDLSVRSSNTWASVGRGTGESGVWASLTENVTWQAWKLRWHLISHHKTRFCFSQVF